MHDAQIVILDQATATDSPPLALQNPPRRVLIVSGSYGAGHDSAAHEIRRRILESGRQADIIDVADLFPLRLGQLLRSAYFAQLRYAPGSWGVLLRCLGQGEEPSAVGQRASALSGRLPAKSIAAAVCPQTDLVVSTHPFASQALGILREQGLLTIPAVTYLTDASVHPLWVHPAVDLHVAIHDEAAREARALGARGVRVIAPLTPRVERPHGNERAMLRTALGLDPSATIALISSGSEGAGDVRLAARDVRATGVATPVVLCGRNERLRRQVEREAGVVAVGWIEGLTEALRGSDCLIQNSGGFTSLEALALGTPVISYRCLPGHGRSSADALLHEGLAMWPQDLHELQAAIVSTTATECVPLTRHWAQRDSLLQALPLGLPVEVAC